MKSLTLPGSGVEIKFTESFNKDSVSSFVSRVMTEEGTLEDYRTDPRRALSSLGVEIRTEDFEKINPEDLGVLRQPGNVGPQAWAAAAVAVAVFCYPSRADQVGKPSNNG